MRILKWMLLIVLILIGTLAVLFLLVMDTFPIETIIIGSLPKP